MKKHIKGIIAGFLIATLMFSGITVFASTGWQSAQILYNNIKITLDGETLTPRNAQGDIVEPFIMGGSTFLPLRALAEALGLNVDWDPNTQTAILTTPPPVIERSVLDAYEIRGIVGPDPWSRHSTYEEHQSFRMLGYDYVGYVFGSDLHNAAANLNTFYNFGGRHTTLKATFGRVDGSGTREGTFNIYLDDELFTGYTLSSTMPTHDIVINLTGVRIMRLEVIINAENAHQQTGPTQYGFGNITLE